MRRRTLDFNAKSQIWGSPKTHLRGEAVVDWTAGSELRLLNRWLVSNCVRYRGESIVYLSWVSPALAGRVRVWRVVQEVETLSDYLYIRMEMRITLGVGGQRFPFPP